MNRLKFALVCGATAVGLALMPEFARGQVPQRRPDVRFLSTPDNVVEAMLELAEVTPADVVYDLGSGDGRIPITAAKKYGARGVGVEIDLSVENSEPLIGAWSELLLSRHRRRCANLRI